MEPQKAARTQIIGKITKNITNGFKGIALILYFCMV